MNIRRLAAAGSLALGGLFLALTIFERRRPLRTPTESKLVRLGRNAALGAMAAATANLVERPIVQPLARVVARRRWGLLYRLRLPRVFHTVAAILLLDYTLYLWHIGLHRVPWLWRFHLVHHVDRDLDASTALRFHFGELALSTPWRAAQIAIIGVPPRALRAWQNAVLVSILFHHSNVALPFNVERALGWVLVTPRLHGRHHSIVPEEMDSNWSSGLTLWDRLHGTLRPPAADEVVTIGAPGFPAPGRMTLARCVRLPFEDATAAPRSPSS